MTSSAHWPTKHKTAIKPPGLSIEIAYNKKRPPPKGRPLDFAAPASYSRSERFQLIRSPSVVLLLLLDEDDPLWSLWSLSPLRSL